MTTTAVRARQQHRSEQEGTDVPSAMLTHAENTQTHALRSVAAVVDLVEEEALTNALPCRQNPADLWFAELPDEVEVAKSLCGPCPVREACLASALERGEPWGVWGGQLLVQGTVVPRKRPRGRPRKQEVAA
ncbi:transcription factor WhiB [Ornithinimicrobium humiphilum]|uniref:Transcriptional regulator WhiB n=1 Tax=Ornithinimicrobium humiphilum TaxID=125288 RepID=A0A543KQY7_9MICO|nr:transcription factor WhiB [Ornithinimicrobium humiphilum]